MASCEMIGSTFAARITYSVTQDVAQNRSVVRVTRVEMRALAADWTTLNVGLVGLVKINGTQAATMEATATTGCGFTMTTSYAGGGEGDWWFSGFSTQDVTVYHETDGNAKISVYANLEVYYNQSRLDYGINKTVSVSLPQIPRVSALTAAGVELGTEMTIQITREAAGFSDTVSWSCGSQSGTIAEKTQLTRLTWTPPLNLASQAPEDTKVPVVLTLTTFAGSTQVGRRQLTVSCTLPKSMVPTLAVAVEDRMGYSQTYGGYVQSRSQARVTTQAAGVYGSAIRLIAVRCGQLSGTGADVCFALGESGKTDITVTVTDSRGRSASCSTSITVLPYREPQVTVREAFRCDESGEPKPDGQWLKVVFDGSVTQLEGNGATYRGICTVHNGEDTRSVLLTDYTGQQTVTEGSFLLTAGIDTSYDCQVSVQDDFCTVVSGAALVSVAFALIDLCRDTRAVGIGMRARNAGKLSIGMDMDMDEHSIGNLADPEQAQDAATRAYVDTAARKAAPWNLLDNSDFRNPVNQRGQTSYTAYGYCIDRWKSSHSFPISVNASYITVSGSESYHHLMQAIEKYSLLIGKTLTLAIRCKGESGNNVRLRIIDSSANVYGGTAHTLTGDWQTVVQTVTIPGEISTTSIWFAIYTAGTLDVSWAALYEGEYTADTLPEYRCKGYGAELLECMRYAAVFDYSTARYGVAVGSIKSTTTANVYIPYPVRMRVTPSISDVSGGNWSMRFDGTIYTPESISPWFASQHFIGMRVNGAFSSDNIGKAVVLNSNSAASVVFSADL